MRTQSIHTIPGFKKRLLFVCGKGGVGKTTIACSMGLHLARQGRKVLLIGIHSTDQISRVFKIPTIGIKATELEKGLDAIHLDEQLAFDSFIRKSFKFKAIYKRIIESPVYQYFTAAAPGIKELIALETIEQLLESSSPRYDHVLIDCPSTGHGLSYFDVGRQAVRAFPLGPLRKIGERVQSLLADSTKVGALIVTLAEEMPTNEAIELYAGLESRKIEVDGLVVNALFSNPHTALETIKLEQALQEKQSFINPELIEKMMLSGLFYASRNVLNQSHLNRLQEHFRHPLIEIPFLANEAKDLVFLEEIGKFLSQQRLPNP